MLVTPRQYVPREYQVLARDFLLDVPRAALWAMPGLGKTSMVFAALDILKMCGSSFFPVLVLAPKNVALNVWPEEQKKWIEFHGMRVVPILGERDARDDALMRRGDIYVINYENVQWLVQKLGRKWPFKIIVADESTKLKNYRLKGGGARSSALAQIANATGRWINLTGTPSPNGLKDLWGQTWFQDFGQRLGHGYTDYMRRWFYSNPYTRIVEPHAHSFEEIHRLLADITMALRTEDWLDVHKPQEFPVFVDLPPAIRRLYDQMERDFFIENDVMQLNAANSAALSGKLLQMASGAVYDINKQVKWLHEAKIEALQSIVNDLAGEPLLVSYWHRWEVPMLQKAFPDMRIYRTKKDEDDWNSGKIGMMGVQPASVGHGVNLQFGGRAMAFYTHIWDLELRDQIVERIGPARQLQAGLDRVVLLYNIIARNTLDEEVIERNISKRSVQDALMRARARQRGERSPVVELDYAELSSVTEAWAGLI